MKGLPRGAFDRQVDKAHANKHSKGFGCWDQLLAMLFAQLSGSSSLRTLEAGFNSQQRHHYHLGTRAIRRSTLADANAKRSVEPFQETAKWLMGQASRQLRRDGQALLYLLDSTSLTLKGRGFDSWTSATRTRNTQGMKVHLLVSAHEPTPVWHSMTAANVNDIDEAHRLEPEPGALYVFDKGYCDYSWWHQLDQKGARFVTRFKRNAALHIQEHRVIAPEEAEQVLSDCLVTFKHKHPGAKRKNPYTQPLRYLEIARPEHSTSLILASNDLDSPARVIAQRYKDRWQIELFFKWIKQHLGIKQFLGQSENAVKIQVLTALIAYLLLALYKKRHGLSASLWQVLAELRVSLFSRPETAAWMARERRCRMNEFHAKQPVLF
ncbi:IS4 family transposase [Pseudomonas sp. 2FG]|uniref:IS4 family transposase n=1 Tax=Pseudomonas sp. 2FG TaxID=2502191 RepID=UPI002115B2DD|nr:IS4 family transposase [Pseudomonas sp. 2FG]